MPITPGNFPSLQEISNGEAANSLTFNRPLFALSTRTNSLKTLLETVEAEVVNARDGYASLDARLDDMFGNAFSDSNIFVTGGLATWNAATSTFTYSTIVLVQPDKSYNYTINSGAMSSIADGASLYVTLSRDPLSTTLTLVKVAAGAVPNDKDSFVIATRYGTKLWVRGSGEFEDQETKEMGDGVTSAILGRLEMSDENDTDSHFTNTTIITIADTIPAAISKLDKESEYLIRDRNIILHGGGNVGWLVSGGLGAFSFSSSLVMAVPSVGDITVAPTTISNIANDEVIYLAFNRSGTNYTTTLSKIASDSLPLSNGHTDNLVIGYRSGDTFVLRTGEAFQSGEVKPLGVGGSGLVVFQNMSLFPSSADDLTWDASAGQITCPGDVTIHFPWASVNNTIPFSEFPIYLSGDGKKAYVVLDRESDANLTVVSDVDTIPITYAQPDVLLVAERVGDAVYLFGNQRFNDGDIRRIGEGFTAGEIYDDTYTVTTVGGESIVTLPNGGTHSDDDKTLKVWGNGVLLAPNVDYTEGPTVAMITAKVGEMFSDGKFPEDMVLRFRIESIVTGGAGSGGGGTGGITWGDPVNTNIIPDFNMIRNLGSNIKGFRSIYLADITNPGEVYRLYISSGSLQTVRI